MAVLVKLKVGDLLPGLLHTLTLADGTTPFGDLTGYTIQLRWRLKGSATWVVRTATIIDAVNSVVAYNWLTGDTDVAGIYDAEWIATSSLSEPSTFPTVNYFQFQLYKTLDQVGQYDIFWSDVVELDSKLSSVSTALQEWIIDWVNSRALNPVEFGGESTSEYRLARLYLAAHHGTLARRSGSSLGAVVSQTVGPISRSYASPSGGGSDSELSATTWGQAWLALVRASPARAPQVI